MIRWMMIRFARWRMRRETQTATLLLHASIICSINRSPAKALEFRVLSDRCLDKARWWRQQSVSWGYREAR